MNKSIFSDSQVLEQLKNSKLFFILILAIFILVSLKVLFPSPTSTNNGDGTLVQTPAVHAAVNQWRKWEEEIEKDLANFLSHLRGAGKVQVMVSLQNDESYQRAVDVDKKVSITTETDPAGGKRTIREEQHSERTVQDQSSGTVSTVFLGKTAPTVRGVIVIAEGAADPQVKANLAHAVATYFGIPLYKVQVLEK